LSVLHQNFNFKELLGGYTSYANTRHWQLATSMASDILLITCCLESKSVSLVQWAMMIDEAESELAALPVSPQRRKRWGRWRPQKCPLPSTTKILNQALNNAVLG
jgi:hypothetical protein